MYSTFKDQEGMTTADIVKGKDEDDKRLETRKKWHFYSTVLAANLQFSILIAFICMDLYTVVFEFISFFICLGYLGYNMYTHYV